LESGERLATFQKSGAVLLDETGFYELGADVEHVPLDGGCWFPRSTTSSS
jgi:hypothetical protein